MWSLRSCPICPLIPIPKPIRSCLNRLLRVLFPGALDALHEFFLVPSPVLV